MGGPNQPSTNITIKTPAHLQVATSQLSILVGSYNNHFPVYCRGRSNVTQTLPNAVWKQVYADFLKYCDGIIASDPDVNCVEDLKLKAEVTLKRCLKNALESVETGTSNQSGSSKASLQQDEVLKRLKETDDHSRRLMCDKRANLMLTASAGSSQKGSASDSDSKPPLPKTASKIELLRQGAAAMDVMADSISSSGNRMNEILAEELEVSKKRAKVIEDSHELSVKRFKMDEEFPRSSTKSKNFLAAIAPTFHC